MLREFSPDLQHPRCVRITGPALDRTPPNYFLLTAARHCAEIEQSMHKVRTYNAISTKGLDRLGRDCFEVSSDMSAPDAILLRSHKLSAGDIPESVSAIARAGAG